MNDSFLGILLILQMVLTAIGVVVGFQVYRGQGEGQSGKVRKKNPVDYLDQRKRHP
jgi:hypothetical protein